MSKRITDMTKPELEHCMDVVGQAIETILPDGALFVLIVVDDMKTSNCVTNMDRARVIRLLRAQADAMEAL